MEHCRHCSPQSKVEMRGVTLWQIRPIWICLLWDWAVKQKVAWLTQAGLSAEPLPWDVLLFKEDGNLSQVWGSPWDPPPCEIMPHPATGDPPGILIFWISWWCWSSGAAQRQLSRLCKSRCSSLRRHSIPWVCNTWWVNKPTIPSTEREAEDHG